MKQIVAALVVAAASAGACGHGSSSAPGSAAADPGAGAPPLVVTSSAFTAGAAIPAAHTCQGDDVSPAIAWTGAPASTAGFAVVVDDPDAPDPAAPKKTFVHWVVANLPASAHDLAPDAGKSLPAGAVVGENDFGVQTWKGPCPPIGRHRYFFKVYALDAAGAAAGKAGISKPDLLAAIAGHVVGYGELIGTYEKTK